MLDLVLTVPEDARPGYLRIAEALRNAIQAGQAKSGERLPSSRVLAQTLGVHRHTVTAAMDELVAEGWLEAGERRAHRVCEVLPSAFFSPKAGGKKASPFERKFKWRLARQGTVFPCGVTDTSGYPYAFLGGQPDLQLFPYDEFRACVADTLRRSPSRRSDYGSPAGHPEFIACMEEYLRRVRALTGRKIIITHGAQEAIFLTAQLLVMPGDKVAVESPGYAAAWDAIRAAGGEVVPLKVDAQGMDPDSLEEAIGQHRIRLIYLTPHHQYPTTVTLPKARRLRIYELASRHQIPILEDDYDHEFHFRSQPIAPMASSDPCGLVIYISTLSKIMFPSARIGFMAVPEDLLEPLTRLRALVTRQNSIFMQDAVARWMDNGGFERHLKRMRRVYQERRDAMVQALEAGRERGLPLNWSVPDGGMALWFDCGVDSDAVVARARAAGVYVTPESEFHLTPPARLTHLRLGYASQAPQQLQEGMGLLMDAIAAAQRSSRRKAG
ncbi:MAG TPA: PLP-dependent aminotransferase family protein [Gammaproteobacteria bacterium]|jgi:GntR family transcriptional regulator/MocR family aminotransferase|nr:PLP-dependent aminotransferase family protein [Gammaproteobacteria bacterium]